MAWAWFAAVLALGAGAVGGCDAVASGAGALGAGARGWGGRLGAPDVALPNAPWHGEAEVRWTAQGQASVLPSRQGLTLPALSARGQAEGAARARWEAGALREVVWGEGTARADVPMVGAQAWRVEAGSRWDAAQGGTPDAPTQALAIAHAALREALDAVEGGAWALEARTVPADAVAAWLDRGPLDGLTPSPIEVRLLDASPTRACLSATWRATSPRPSWRYGARLDTLEVEARARLWVRRADGLPETLTLEVEAQTEGGDGAWAFTASADGTLTVTWAWPTTPTTPTTRTTPIPPQELAPHGAE